MSLLDYYKKFVGRGNEVSRDKRKRRRNQRLKLKQKRERERQIRNLQRDVDFRKDMMKAKTFTYAVAPSQKNIDKQIIKNQKKNIRSLKMGGAGGGDIFDIDMPRPDIPKQKKKFKLQYPHALWKLIP